jgi:hypothetical protein
MLIMTPSIIFLPVRIVPLRKIHVVPMRIMFPTVVINDLATIPSMVIAVIRIVVTRMLGTTRDKDRTTQSQRQRNYRKTPP